MEQPSSSIQQSRKPPYKFCIVPKCRNTIRNAPDKVFFFVPRGVDIRKKWCKIMKRDMVSPSTCLYCCEDHFDVEEDTYNYMKYKILYLQEKQKTTLRLKKGILPHKFQCQKDIKSQPPSVKKGFLKRKHLEMIKGAQSGPPKQKSNPTGKELRDEAYLEHYTLKTVAEDEPLSLIKNPTHTDSETDSCSMKSEYEEFEEVICKKENDKEETTDCIDDIDNRNINNTDKTIKIEKIEENDTDSEEMRPYEDVNTNIHIKHEMIVKTEAYEEHGIDIEEMQLEFAVNTSDNTKLQIKDDNNDSNLETDLVPDAPTRKRKTAKKVLERKWRRRN